MRRLLQTLALLLVVTAAHAAALPRITPETVHRGGRISYEVDLPRVSGTAFDAAINRTLREFLIPDTRELPSDYSYKARVKYDVPLATPQLLSVRYQVFAETLLPDGRRDGAHPYRANRALTFDLRDGRLIPLDRLFKHGSDWRVRLAQEVAKKDLEMPKKGCGYYLTPSKLVLVHLSDVNLAIDTEVPMAYSDLAGLIDPAGPLAPLLHRK